MGKFELKKVAFHDEDHSVLHRWEREVLWEVRAEGVELGADHVEGVVGAYISIHADSVGCEELGPWW